MRGLESSTAGNTFDDAESLPQLGSFPFNFDVENNHVLPPSSVRLGPGTFRTLRPDIPHRKRSRRLKRAAQPLRARRRRPVKAMRQRPGPEPAHPTAKAFSTFQRRFRP